MKELLEEYGGLILGVLIAGLMMLFILWCMESGGPFHVLAEVFAKITFGS